MAFDESLPSVWQYRIEQAENEIVLKADKEYVDQIAGEVKSLRRAVIGLMTAIISSSVLVSFTLFVTLGSHLAS